jgi:hypothetical protein
MKKRKGEKKMMRNKGGFGLLALVITVLVVFGLVFTVSGAAQKVELTGWLIDKCCSEKTKDPSKHTRMCNLMESCAATGYGVMVKQSDGSYKFYKFDSKGDTLATNYLKKTTKEDNLTVTVKGTWDGKLLKITSLVEKNLPIELSGWLMDKCCVAKVADPAKHTRTCNLMESCSASGYGISVMQPDYSYKFYKFDQKGDFLAADFLKKTARENNLTILVTGTWDGAVLKVTSFQETNGQVVNLMGWLIDKHCAEVTKNPAIHTRACNMMENCAASGYGVMVKQADASYKFYKFDQKGDDLAADYLKKTTKEDNLTMMVKGTWDGAILQDASLMECSGI